MSGINIDVEKLEQVIENGVKCVRGLNNKPCMTSIGVYKGVRIILRAAPVEYLEGSFRRADADMVNCIQEVP